MLCGFQRFLEACMLQEVCSEWMTVEYTFVENNVFWKLDLESCGTLSVDED